MTELYGEQALLQENVVVNPKSQQESEKLTCLWREKWKMGPDYIFFVCLV